MSQLLAAIFVFAFAAAGRAATYYVANGGDDSNSGSLNAPFRTVVKGHSLLNPGDTLYIRGGTYDENCNCLMKSGTSWAAPITIARYQNENVIFLHSSIFQILGAAYVILDGITIDQSIGEGIWLGRNSHDLKFLNMKITNAQSHGFLWNRVPPEDAPDLPPHHITIQNCEIANVGLRDSQSSNAIYIKGNDNIVDGCYIHDVPGSGIQAYDAGNSIDLNRNNIFRNNRIDNMPTWDADNWAHGIVFSTGPNTLVYNNIITRIHSGANHIGTGTGILVMSNNDNSALYNNTVGQMADGGPGIAVQYSNNVTIKNNLLFSNPLNIRLYQSTQTFENNLCDVSGPGCALVGDPKFVDASAADYHLSASSPAIDTGSTLAEVSTDFDGTPRPQGGAFDIGALEYDGTPSSPTPVPGPDTTSPTVTITSPVNGSTVPR